MTMAIELLSEVNVLFTLSKPLSSLIFSKNGLSGINFEHSWGDGVAVMRLVDEIVTDSMRSKFVGEGDSTSDNLSHGHVERQ